MKTLSLSLKIPHGTILTTGKKIFIYGCHIDKLIVYIQYINEMQNYLTEKVGKQSEIFV